jgi:hypothetical protein
VLTPRRMCTFVVGKQPFVFAGKTQHQRRKEMHKERRPQHLLSSKVSSVTASIKSRSAFDDFDANTKKGMMMKGEKGLEGKTLLCRGDDTFTDEGKKKKKKKKNEEGEEEEDPKWRKWLGVPSKKCVETLPIICAHCNQKLHAKDIPYGYNERRYDDDDLWKTTMKTKFTQLSRDLETNEFLLRSSKRPQFVNARRSRACTRLREREGKSLTEANAIIGRGKMFVLSREHAWTLVGKRLIEEGDGDKTNFLSENGVYLDIGSGEGEVASKLGEYFGTVVATETSPSMVKRCAESHEDWTVLETGTIENVWEKFKEQNIREEEERTSRKSEAAKRKVRRLLEEEEAKETETLRRRKFDCIGMFNVLDRCDRPFTMLSHVRNLLKPNAGLFVLAVVLPFRPFVELDDGARRAPVERLDVATPTSAWEYGVRDLYENVLKPSGFHIEAIARVPYICEGDHLAGAYVLDDCIFVLKRV